MEGGGGGGGELESVTYHQQGVLCKANGMR